MAPFATSDFASRKSGLLLVSAESKDVTTGFYRFWPKDDDGNQLCITEQQNLFLKKTFYNNDNILNISKLS